MSLPLCHTGNGVSNISWLTGNNLMFASVVFVWMVNCFSCQLIAVS